MISIAIPLLNQIFNLNVELYLQVWTIYSNLLNVWGRAMRTHCIHAQSQSLKHMTVFEFWGCWHINLSRRPNLIYISDTTIKICFLLIEIEPHLFFLVKHTLSTQAVKGVVDCLCHFINILLFLKITCIAKPRKESSFREFKLLD